MNGATTLSSPKVERNGNITILTFTADAVRDVENSIDRDLETLPDGTEQQQLLLDFTHVASLNSMELGSLVTLHKRVAAAGGRLTLFNLSDQVFKIFTITRLDTLLEICRAGAVVSSDGWFHATDSKRGRAADSDAEEFSGEDETEQGSRTPILEHPYFLLAGVVKTRLSVDGPPPSEVWLG